MRITENKERRDALFGKLTEDRAAGGFPHQYEVWPCVRLGAGGRFLHAQGLKFPPHRGRALAFLRGRSVEALIVRPDLQPAFVYRGVICRPDQWTANADIKAHEIKSTRISARRMWDLLTNDRDTDAAWGEFDLQGNAWSYMRNYFEQSRNYAAATGVNPYGLTVHFLNGEYAQNRKYCSECKGNLAPIEQGLFKQCLDCGYKSYTEDLRTYDMEFTGAELAWARREVFGRRARQFRAAVKARSILELRNAAAPTRNFRCGDCGVGHLIECEHAGEQEAKRR